MKLLPTNYVTFIGGILAGLPPIILAAAMSSNFTLSSKVTFGLSVVQGIGTLVIGLAAKDWNTHSTQQQINEATAKAQSGQLPKA